MRRARIGRTMALVMVMAVGLLVVPRPAPAGEDTCTRAVGGLMALVPALRRGEAMVEHCVAAEDRVVLVVGGAAHAVRRGKRRAVARREGLSEVRVLDGALSAEARVQALLGDDVPTELRQHLPDGTTWLVAPEAVLDEGTVALLRGVVPGVGRVVGEGAWQEAMASGRRTLAAWPRLDAAQVEALVEAGVGGLGELAGTPAARLAPVLSLDEAGAQALVDAAALELEARSAGAAGGAPPR